MDKLFKVKVNDSYEFNLNETNVENLDVINLSNKTFHFLHNNKTVHVKIEKSNYQNKSYEVSVNSNSYSVKIEDELAALIAKMGFSLGSSKRTNLVKAPMPGIILAINVAEGQQVKEGESLLILEAMKMENSLNAPNDAIVKTIHVVAGETCEKGTLLIEFE